MSGNPNHDEKGRFTDGPSSSAGGTAPKLGRGDLVSIKNQPWKGSMVVVERVGDVVTLADSKGKRVGKFKRHEIEGGGEAALIAKIDAYDAADVGRSKLVRPTVYG